MPRTKFDRLEQAAAEPVPDTRQFMSPINAWLDRAAHSLRPTIEPAATKHGGMWPQALQIIDDPELRDPLLGECYLDLRQYPVIKICVRRHRDDLALLGTIAHELVHAAIYESGHGPTFEAVAKEICLKYKRGKPEHAGLDDLVTQAVPHWYLAVLDRMDPAPRPPLEEERDDGSSTGDDPT